MLSRLHQLSGYKRAVGVWVGFMLILWGAFGIAALMHPSAFIGVEASPTTESMTGAPLFGFIVLMNGIVILLVAGGNIFARLVRLRPGW